ncbi:MAG: hypothetical protein K6A96_11485 [Prevotella sp.]|nr:hypothetical protein [Prevotella sp.]
MKRTVLSILISLLAVLPLAAQDRLAEIEELLREAPVQEKIYVHMDNTCYFKGDTVWYKAYVVRADDLTYTDMSRITYVELLSPDGMMVERQMLVTSPKGWTAGNFVLQDSLYSGYYEIRAYTRWMMNFRVTHREYNYLDRLAFYDRRMADDFFRDYGTLYSRVFPVYERPATPGSYDEKYVVSRPKMRLDKELKERLHVSFYPEGGHLIAGTRCRVAFEAYDEEGQQVDIEGQLNGMPIRTEHEGRGAFMVDVPEKGGFKADFRYEDKDYHFDLPKVEEQGCALTLHDGDDQMTAELTLKGTVSEEYAVVVLCRGILKVFRRIRPDGEGRCKVSIDKSELPTGVCDLIVIDAEGHPLADRLFFVDNHDYADGGITVSGLKSEYKPLEQAEITLQAPVGTEHISVSVRDGATDEPTYDTGNIMTDLLLSSELQGFIPHADYYFESDDEQHRRHLDLLMMVQGWRRYDYQELADTIPLRYEPEQMITVEGGVYPYESDEDFTDLTAGDLVKMIEDSPEGKAMHSAENEEIEDSAIEQDTGKDFDDDESDFYQEESASGDDNRYLRKRGRMKKEVTLKSELVQDIAIAEAEMQTHDGGRFEFSVPPYYGDAILFMMAHEQDITEEKLKKYEKNWAVEGAMAKYYVKRDLFFPIFPKKYSYYQCHQPEDDAWQDDASYLPVNAIDSISKMDRTLPTVTIKKRRRRSLHAVDYSKPAFVIDTQEIYNLGIDYGMLTGFYRVNQLPQAIAHLLLGTIYSYGVFQKFNVEAQVDGYIFYRDYYCEGKDQRAELEAINPFRSGELIVSQLKLKRQDEIRVYTDLEPRNPDVPRTRSMCQPDMKLDLRLVPDAGERPTYRDRRIILHGFYMPDHFYHRDYSHKPKPSKVQDYRRTLYWNPNAQLDSDGCFTATFYNNNKTTRVKVSAVGLTDEGQPVYYKPEVGH